jgi:hypothetical protein
MAHSSDNDTVIGEIIASSTGAFTAQCIEVPASETLRLIDPPEFGSVVKITANQGIAASTPSPRESDGEIDPFAAGEFQNSGASRFEPGIIFAVVANSQMSSLDSARRPMALGYATEDELRLHQPQVFELIVSEFSGPLIGHVSADGRLLTRIPPMLPRIHSRVYRCSGEEIVAATSDLRWLRRIRASTSIGEPAEELCAAIVRAGWSARADSAEYLTGAGRQLLEVVGGDYDRLQLIIRAVAG